MLVYGRRHANTYGIEKFNRGERTASLSDSVLRPHNEAFHSQSPKDACLDRFYFITVDINPSYLKSVPRHVQSQVKSRVSQPDHAQLRRAFPDPSVQFLSLMFRTRAGNDGHLHSPHSRKSFKNLAMKNTSERSV